MNFRFSSLAEFSASFLSIPLIFISLFAFSKSGRKGHFHGKKRSIGNNVNVGDSPSPIQTNFLSHLMKSKEENESQFDLIVSAKNILALQLLMTS
jgi:hypothetical protein